MKSTPSCTRCSSAIAPGMVIIVAILSLAFQAPVSAQTLKQTVPQPKAGSQANPRNSRGVKPAHFQDAEGTPQTPFQRVVVPGLKRLHPVYKAKRKPRRANRPSAVTPNFGGFVAAPKFLAFDVTDGDTSGIGLFASGDFNKDGKPDLVTVQPTGAVNVMLNLSPAGSSGTGVYFGAPITTAPGATNVGTASQAIAIDVNGDGYDDLVLLDPINNWVDVLINNTDGTFAAPVTLGVGNPNYANAFAMADLNGDGHPDLLLLSSSVTFDENFNASTTMEFDTYLNDGTGSFLAPGNSLKQIQNYNAYYQPLTGRSIVLTDVNQDGKADATVEVIHWLTTDSPDENHVILTMLGIGTGAFHRPNPTATLKIPAESTFNIGYPLVANLSVVDVNNDTFKDIVFSYQDYSIYVALGNGDGTYQYPNNVGATQAYPTDLAVADVNGDGIPDLVDAEPGYLSIYPGHGDGTFDLPTIRSYGSGMGQFSVLLTADFNGDGLPDAAIMNAFEGSVTVFPGVSGAVAAVHGGPLLASTNDVISRIQAQTVLDANGDGNDDIFFYSRGADRDNPVLVTALGDGKGNFSNKNAVPGFVASSFDFADNASGDFNGDGKADIVLHTFTGMSLLLSNGDGSFNPVPISLATGFNCSTNYAAIGDVNGDGKMDIVVAYEGDGIYGCNGGTTPSGFYTLLGNGDGTFQPAIFTALGAEVFQPLLVDLNGDGKLDLEISDVPFDVFGATFNSYILLGNGDGTFGAPTTIAANYINSSTLAADLNGDGHVDLVMLTEGLTDPIGGTFDPGLAGAMVLFGDGAGNVTPGSTFAQGFFSPSGVLSDLNGDGKPDLLLSEYLSYDFVDGFAGGIVGLGNGDGTFTGVGNYEVGDSSTVVLKGNFLNDNAPDAAFVSGGSGTTLLIAQGGTTETLQAASSSIPSGTSASFNVTLTPTLAGRPAPTGTVMLVEGTTQLASAPVSGGTMSLSVDGLAVGSHVVTAVYSGDSNYNINATATATVSVLPAAALVLSSSSASLTVPQGGTGVLTLTVAANASFNGTVALSVSGAPDGVSITLNPASLTLQGGQSVAATLVVSTVQPRSSAVLGAYPAGGSGLLTGLPLLIATVGLALGLLIPRRKPGFSTRLASLGGLAVVLVAGSLTACGGSGSGYHVAPKGTATLTVTAQPSGGSVAPQTTTVQLTIN